MEDIESQKYPIGKFEEQPFAASEFSGILRDELLLEIKSLPALLEYSVLNLDSSQLNSAYRAGGWTICQVVHHVADSHMNAYIRCKLAFTENNPTISPYDQNKWAILADSRLPVNISLTLLHALHLRWYEVFHKLNIADWQRTFFHPEQNKTIRLWDVLKTYAWHGKHHVAQINELRKRKNW